MSKTDACETAGSRRNVVMITGGSPNELGLVVIIDRELHSLTRP